MPAPSALAIATSSLNRLVKEEASYHRELEQQQASIVRLEQGESTDENADYILKQERQALAETEAIFPQLRDKIKEARETLEQQIYKDRAPGDEPAPEDITKAQQAIAASRAVVRDTY